jgi:hypothetical protein
LQKSATKDETKNIVDYKGGGGSSTMVFPPKNSIFIKFKGNIEGFKKYCNSITLL